MNYEKILKIIKPTAEEMQKSNKTAKMIINEINKEGYEAVLVGSSARNTYLKNSHDLDIFVYFPKNINRERFEELGLKIGKTVLKKYRPQIHYAEHPYTRGIVDGIKVEIVPCYKIEKGEKIISSVDRTPLHNQYLLKKINGFEDQVLLLKQFMKAQKCYGSDEKVQGFSGLMCETLIIYYKTFDKAIEAISNWGEKILINVKKGDEIKFKGDQLIAIDPVDENRNMAASVSRKTLSKLIFKAREFLKNPSQDFFFPKGKKINFNEMIKIRRIVMIHFAYPSGIIEEIIWSQLRKITKSLKKKLEEEGFVVLNNFFWTDEKRQCAVLFEVESLTLNLYKKRKGPEIFEPKHVEKFIEKHKKVWIERNRLYAWQKRKCTDIRDYLMLTIQKEKLPSHIESAVKRGKVLQQRDLKRYKFILKEYEDELIV